MSAANLKQLLAQKQPPPATAEQTKQALMATGIDSGQNLNYMPPAVKSEAPTPPAPPPEGAVVRYKANFLHRVACGGWFYPVDGYFTPTNDRQLQTMEKMAATGIVTREVL